MKTFKESINEKNLNQNKFFKVWESYKKLNYGKDTLNYSGMVLDDLKDFLCFINTELDSDEAKILQNCFKG